MSVYTDLQGEPLTLRDHQDPDKHMIGEGLGTPSKPGSGDTTGGLSSPGVSPFIAREDHSHKLGNGVVDTAQIATGAVTNNKLFNNTSSPWTPTFNNLTVGNGTLNARHCLLGCFEYFYLQLIFGSGTSIAGSVQITNLPSPIYLPSNQTAISNVEFIDNSPSGTYYGYLAIASASAFIIRRLFDSGITGNPTQVGGIAGGIPITWTTADVLNVSAFYLTA